MQRYLTFILVAAIIGLGVLATPVKAQEATEVRLPVVCVNQKLFLETVDEFEELPFIRGLSTRDGADNSLVVFLSPKTKTWSIVEKVGNRYCILAVGEGMEPVPSDVIEDFQKRQKKSKM